MITKKKEWITTKELAEIKGIGDRAVRKYVQDNKYVVRKTSKSYEFLVTSLEENVREKITELEEKLTPKIEENYIVPEEQKCKHCGYQQRQRTAERNEQIKTHGELTVFERRPDNHMRQTSAESRRRIVERNADRTGEYVCGNQQTFGRPLVLRHIENKRTEQGNKKYNKKIREVITVRKEI